MVKKYILKRCVFHSHDSFRGGGGSYWQIANFKTPPNFSLVNGCSFAPENGWLENGISFLEGLLTSFQGGYQGARNQNFLDYQNGTNTHPMWPQFCWITINRLRFQHKDPTRMVARMIFQALPAVRFRLFQPQKKMTKKFAFWGANINLLGKVKWRSLPKIDRIEWGFLRFQTKR